MVLPKLAAVRLAGSYSVVGWDLPGHGGPLVVLEDAAHLPPVEAPSAVVKLIVGDKREAPG